MRSAIKRKTALILSLVGLLWAGGLSLSFADENGDSDCPDLPDPIAQTPLSDAGWKCVDHSEDLTLFNRTAKGSSIRELMAIARIEAAPRKVLEVIADFDHYPDFMPYVKQCEAQTRGENHWWIFQQLDFPWPVSDRYYTIDLHRDLSQSEQGTYHVSWDLADDPAARPHRGKGEAVQINKGYWHLQAEDGDRRTRVAYYLHTDPGGELPTFVVNMANNIAVPRVIAAVRKRSRQK